MNEGDGPARLGGPVLLQAFLDFVQHHAGDVGQVEIARIVERQPVQALQFAGAGDGDGAGAGAGAGFRAETSPKVSISIARCSAADSRPGAAGPRPFPFGACRRCRSLRSAASQLRGCPRAVWRSE